MASGDACAKCGRSGREIAWSYQLNANICRDCLPVLVPPPARRPYKRPPDSKPTRYARFVDHIYERLEVLTPYGAFSHGDGRHWSSYCPACGDGTILITFAEINGVPAARYSHPDGDGCSAGCSSGLIVQVIG